MESKNGMLSMGKDFIAEQVDTCDCASNALRVGLKEGTERPRDFVF